ncbi:unnamed protein product, partial [Amoebophrya sp. A25]
NNSPPRNNGGGGGGSGERDSTGAIRLCWHFCKDTPCSNKTHKKGGKVYCDKGLHPTKAGDISKNEYEKVRKGGLGKRILGKTDFESWLKESSKEKDDRSKSRSRTPKRSRD